MLRPGDVILASVLCLLCLGAIMVNSAGLTVGGMEGAGGEPVTFLSIVFSRSTAYMGIAIAAMAFAARAPVHRLVLHAGSRVFLLRMSLLLVGFCLFVYLPGVGMEINGAKRWIGVPAPGFGVISFQPSEVAKWGVILALAAYGASHAHEFSRFFSGLFPALCATGLVAGVIITEDLGTGLLITATAGVMLIAAGARIWHFLAMAPLVVFGFVGAIITRPYRMQRLATFLNPYAEPEGAGYHMIQSMVAVANGRVFGRGLGFGLQKFGYLPADRSDFLFAVICEELGLAGAAVIITLYLAIIWAGWRIVRNEGLAAMRLVGLGVLTAFGLQALMNLAVVTGLGPTKGIALPLLSSGGTGWILTAASLGLLVGMDRRHRLERVASGPGADDAGRGATTIEPKLVAPALASGRPA